MSNRPHRRSLNDRGPSYSRIGTFLAISLAVFCFVVVPIKLAADASPYAAAVFFGLECVLALTIFFAFKAPVTQRERVQEKMQAPMELDASAYNPTKDGVPW